MNKKNIFAYLFVYLSLAVMLIVPFVFNQNQVRETTTIVDGDDSKTKIELVCDDVVVGIISSYPGEKISYPNEVENNLSSYTNIEGWYTDKALTDKFSFETQPATNLTLYAKTTEEKTNLTFIIFWSFSILSAIGLGVLFYSLNRYYSKQNKDKPKKVKWAFFLFTNATF